MGYDEVFASNRWLHKFQVWHNIKCYVLSGESVNVKIEVVEGWNNGLDDICKGYEIKDIFNCDKTMFF